MEKEGFRGYLNSRNGKVNLALLFSIVLVFVFFTLSVEAITVTLTTPSNYTYNGTSSRNINFTFNVSTQANGEIIQGCSLWTNDTSQWRLAAVNGTGSVGGNPAAVVQNGSIGLSWINYTFTSDGNFTWNIGCNASASSGYTFQNPGGGSGGNITFFIDTQAPTISLGGSVGSQGQLGGALADNTEYNITSYDTAAFNITVFDNSTQFVWVILNNIPFVNSFAAGNAPAGASVNESNSTATNASITPLTNNNTRLMTAGTTFAPDSKSYMFNLSGLLNFSSLYLGPGPHSVIFCANDTLGRRTCTNQSDFLIKGVNVTQIENSFGTMQQCVGPPPSPGAPCTLSATQSFGGLNMTYGNGTEIPFSTFINPVTSQSNINSSITLIFNFSANSIVSIVGMQIDEKQFANASNAKINNTPTPDVKRQLGTGYQATMAWADINSFLPTASLYQYGIIQLGGTGYSKRMYCNGTTMSDPQCHTISQCNSTAFGLLNFSLVIPSGDGCWLESGAINGQSLSSGYTYIFVPHFSGGLGGADFSQPNVTFNGPLFNGLNTTTASNQINFNVNDINSTGLNLTAASSINVTILQAGIVKFYYTYLNTSTQNLTCTTSDATSPQNSTTISCNATFAFSNGTYVVNVTGRDTSNNSNIVNVTFGVSSISFTVDQIPPVFVYYNFSDIQLNRTGNANFTSGDNTSWGPVQLGGIGGGNAAAGGDGVSTAQGRTIFAIANWTDNLTTPLQGTFQFFNTSTSLWQTLNTSPAAYNAWTNSSWTNFSYNIPSGHNEFEGKNVSFRIIANDTLGNINNSNQVTNFTIQINDTTKPTLLVASVAGASVPNFTNTTNALPTIVWNITDQSAMAYIAIQVDSLVDPNCGGFKNLTTVATTNSQRNGSITISNTGGCTSLGNGTHTARLTAQDAWGNSELYIHQFNVQSGVNPNITLSGLDSQGSATSSANPPMNGSTVTSNTGINFSAIVGGSVTLRSISFTSSCNSTGGNIPQNGAGVTNNTAVKPFQGSCSSSTANQTISVTATDSAGTSTTNLFQFLVDNVAPSISVNAPTNGLTTANNVTINVSADDDVSNISMIGYYLDSNPLVILNSSTFIGTNGNNVTNVFYGVTASGAIYNFTAGTHTIKFTAADAIGTVTNNTVNSSVMTITVTGPVNFGSLDNVLINYLTPFVNTTTPAGINITGINISALDSVAGVYVNLSTTNETSGKTFQIQFNTNTSTTIYLSGINGSAANWDKINFTPVLNATSGFSFINNFINNFSLTPVASVFFNTSINEFLPNNNSYYGVVYLPFNLSGSTSTAQRIWYIANPSSNTAKLTRTNITQCTSAFTIGSSPCWNYTSGGNTIVQVPHFSAIVVANDTAAPWVNVSIPVANQTVGTFVPNISVASDTSTCAYQLNSSTPSNKTMTLVTNTDTPNNCIGSTENFKNLNALIGYNITFWVTDIMGNVNQYIWLFNVSDTTSPNNGVISSSPSTTTATVTVTGANETVNVTVNYGTVNTSLGSSATNAAFNTTESVSLSSLTASTTYYYNVTVCDFNGNCVTNSSLFSFTTSAAPATPTTTTSSSGGGGSAAGAVTPAAGTAASASRQWDSLASGSEGTLPIHNPDIAVTQVTIDVQNTVSNPSLTVGSYSSNPLSTPATDKVYQYLEITNSNIADTDASKITISFAVPKSWMTANSVNADNIVLYRYHSNAWNALPTTKTGEDSLYYTYQATTPGFSTYAVGVQQAVPAAPTAPSAPSAPTAPSAPSAPTAPQAPAQAAPQAAPSGLSTTTIAWIVVALIVVIAAIGYFVMRKKAE